MSRTLLVLSAGIGTPSSSQLLGERLAQATERTMATAGEPVQVQHIQVRTLAGDLANQMVTGVPSPAVQDAAAAAGRAVGVIVVTPVFNASYSGLFKLFFDLLDPAVMVGRPVLLAATGGTARHSLVIDTALLPLFHYLKAAISPIGVFAATGDWGDPSGHLAGRIDSAARAFAELVVQRPGTEPADEFSTELNFADLLRG